MQLSREKVGPHLFMAIHKQNKGTQHHHKLLLHSSCHVKRVLVVATKVEQVTIRVGNEQLLVITGALISSTVNQIATSCHHWWYLFLPHWIIQSTIHLSWPRLVNSHPYLHITALVITVDLIARTVTQIVMSCHHRWYLCLLHLMIQSLIHISCPYRRIRQIGFSYMLVYLV